MSDYTIRPMTESDITPVAELERLCFSSPWSEAALGQSLTQEGACFLVLHEGSAIAGYIGMYVVCGEGQVLNLAVHPAFRRRGYGKALLQAAIDRVEGAVERIFLEVRISNTAAQALYQSLGFVTLGVRKNFYAHPTEDGVVMEKTV